MAILFELVVNFGTDEDALSEAHDTVRRIAPIDGAVPLDPSVSRMTAPRPYIEFSVRARGLGPVVSTAAEIARAQHDLYGVLRQFSGYRAAIVGWDPESLVEVDDLEADRRAGDPPEYAGLVLANDLVERWQLGPDWVAFDDDHRWLPYRSG